jgi:serine/threonine protein phosphatase PrpC
MMKDDQLICANLGDSRAVLASHRPIESRIAAREGLVMIDEERMKWISNPLSRDHKPDIPEEKERINISGGRVSSYIDVDPVTGIKMQSGPARVYLRFDDYPGLAMSRSLGDMVAHSVGVSSEPGKHKNLIYVEIHRHKLSPDDKFMILASDGLWEFVSNEEAIRSVVTHW